jgi:hypothetical protein
MEFFSMQPATKKDRNKNNNWGIRQQFSIRHNRIYAVIAVCAETGAPASQ